MLENSWLTLMNWKDWFFCRLLFGSLRALTLWTTIF
jgi:hypothetical protein